MYKWWHAHQVAPHLQVGEKHAQLKVVVYEGLRHYRHERHEEEVQDSKAKRGRGKKRKLDASSTASWHLPWGLRALNTLESGLLAVQPQ